MLIFTLKGCQTWSKSTKTSVNLDCYRSFDHRGACFRIIFYRVEWFVHARTGGLTHQYCSFQVSVKEKKEIASQLGDLSCSPQITKNQLWNFSMLSEFFFKVLGCCCWMWERIWSLGLTPWGWHFFTNGPKFQTVVLYGKKLKATSGPKSIPC